MPRPAMTPAKEPPKDYAALRANLEWAAVAIKHAETYSAVILMGARQGRVVPLTRVDDELYADFRTRFAELNVDVVDPAQVLIQQLDQDAKQRHEWLALMEAYGEQILNATTQTLIRRDARQGYGEENTLVVNRVQFYALEVARNREGHNQAFIEQLKQEEAQKADKHSHDDHSNCTHPH